MCVRTFELIAPRAFSFVFRLIASFFCIALHTHLLVSRAFPLSRFRSSDWNRSDICQIKNALSSSSLVSLATSNLHRLYFFIGGREGCSDPFQLDGQSFFFSHPGPIQNKKFCPNYSQNGVLSLSLAQRKPIKGYTNTFGIICHLKMIQVNTEAFCFLFEFDFH